jgi:D-alanyl-lipoteichoic acid acyltransferase DltB (MBOAT superfamily)
MLFNSFEFLVFFLVVLALYFWIRPRFRWLLLLAASLYFYMAWRPGYVALLLGAIGVSYWSAIRIEQATVQRRKKIYLAGATAALLSVLFIYKYFNFFNDSVRALVTAMGLPYAVPAIHLLLPIGISFYTFQLLSYVIDVYSGKLRAERNLGILALYGSYFPQLLSGPIGRAGALLKQLHAHHEFDESRIASGLQLMAWGFFKKLVVADRLSLFVERIYSNPAAYDGISLIIGTVFFAFQVYCDFGGYSDIAIGAAKTMGYDLMKNFDRPYFATSIQEFWKRWHISLTSWLTDYVYRPLTRSRLIRLQWYYKFLACLMATFLVSGLWHGAAWTFIVWGALHGTYLVGSVLTEDLRRKAVSTLRLHRAPRLHYGLRVATTFSLVCLTYIFFRASSLADAWYIATHLFSGVHTFFSDLLVGHHVKLNKLFVELKVEFLLGLAGVAVVLGADLLQTAGSVRLRFAALPAYLRWGVYYAGMLTILVMGALGESHQFLYFQF